MAENKSRTIYIAVMGVTGAGKSSFINLLCDEEVDIGHDLVSCTKNVAIYACYRYPHATIYLIDTPGFDDTTRSDTEVLRELATWLAKSYSDDIRLNGLLYFHRISDVRMQGSAKKNLLMFKKLCGQDALKNVVLVTSMWDRVHYEDAVRRETQLKDTPGFWGWMMGKGSKTSRHNNTLASAEDLLRHFVPTMDHKVTLDLQAEMVDNDKTLNETSVGQEVARSLSEQRVRYLRELGEVKQQMREAIQQRDRDSMRIMHEMRVEYERKLDQIQRAYDELKTTMANLHHKRYQELEGKLAAYKRRSMTGATDSSNTFVWPNMSADNEHHVVSDDAPSGNVGAEPVRPEILDGSGHTGPELVKHVSCSNVRPGMDSQIDHDGMIMMTQLATRDKDLGSQFTNIDGPDRYNFNDSKRIECMTFDSTGSLLAVGFRSNLVRVFKTNDWSIDHEIEPANNEMLHKLIFSPYNQHLATFHTKRAQESTPYVRIWNHQGSKLRTLALWSSNRRMYNGFFLKKGRFAGVGQKSGADEVNCPYNVWLRIWDVGTGQQLRTIQISSVARRLPLVAPSWFESDDSDTGDMVVCECKINHRKYICIWSLPPLEPLVMDDCELEMYEAMKVVNEYEVSPMLVSKGSKTLMLYKHDTDGKYTSYPMIDLTPGLALRSRKGVKLSAEDLANYAEYVSIGWQHEWAISANGNIFATSSDGDQGVRLWDTQTGAMLCKINMPFLSNTRPTQKTSGREKCEAMALSPNGTILATADWERLRVYARR